MLMQEKRLKVLVEYLQSNKDKQFLLDELRVELNTRLPTSFRFNNNNVLVKQFVWLPKHGLKIEPIIYSIKLSKFKLKKIKYYRVAKTW